MRLHNKSLCHSIFLLREQESSFRIASEKCNNYSVLTWLPWGVSPPSIDLGRELLSVAGEQHPEAKSQLTVSSHRLSVGSRISGQVLKEVERLDRSHCRRQADLRRKPLVA